MKTNILKILSKARIFCNNFTYTSLKGGANNRVYKINLTENKSLILKHYFHHKNDLRKRLNSEFSFLKFAWKMGIKNIPKPIFLSKKENIGLYSFITGRLARNSDITIHAIQKAIDFVVNLNSYKDISLNLPQASEACFTIDAHLNLIEKRIEKLLNIPTNPQINKDLLNFINKKMLPTWNKIKQRPSIKNINLEKGGFISPSDFGFHNIIINETDIYFIDFEYAGKDDPAKLICDFFCQQKIPVPMKYFNKFTQEICSIISDPETMIKRVNFLFPAYQIKWCCIILNVFLKTENNRRIFSKNMQDPQKQLELAKTLLNKIEV